MKIGTQAFVRAGLAVPMTPQHDDFRWIVWIRILLRCDWTALLGCLIFDVAKSRSEKQWPYSFCSYVEKKDDAVWPGHMPVPMEEILNEMQLRFRVHMCVG